MRPRLKDETATLLKQTDQRLKRVGREDGHPAAAEETLERVKDGRGSGNNYYTRDSVVRLALITLNNLLPEPEEVEAL